MTSSAEAVVVMAGAIVLLALIRLTCHFAGRGCQDHTEATIPAQRAVEGGEAQYRRGTGRSAHLWVPVARDGEELTPSLSAARAAASAMPAGTSTAPAHARRPAV